MRYTTDVTINLPRSAVIRIFDNSDNLFKWQNGLKSIDHIKGKAGEEGAASRLVYAGRKSDLVMTEIIKKRSFPEAFITTYQSKGVYNEVMNFFTETEPGQTHWRLVSIFRFRGMMALMAPFTKSAFAANTLLNMERFKTFAEQNEAQQKSTTI